jgi:uncharacterized protein YoxC
VGDPIFWLGLSLFLVAVSLTAVFVVAVPALRELGRASRSAEKLFDILSRELPPTLEAIRLTGMEITDLTEDVSDSVQSAGRVVQRMDQSLRTVQQQTRRTQLTTRRLVVGVKAAWRTFKRWGDRPTDREPHRRPRSGRLSATENSPFDSGSKTPDSHRDYDLEIIPAASNPAEDRLHERLPPTRSSSTKSVEPPDM